MANQPLRGILLKLQDYLSDDDRKCLHFFLGNDVPRRIRDDPTLGGTLSLIESLFDQDKINEQDFTLLIRAFEQIQCMDAVKILREHMRRMQSNGLHESTQSLALILPYAFHPSLEVVDKIAMETPLLEQQYMSSSSNTIEMGSMENRNINSVIQVVDKDSSQPNKKKLSKRPSITPNCQLLFVFLLLLIIALLVVTIVIFSRSDQLKLELKTKEQIIAKEQVDNLQSMVNQTMQELYDRRQQSANQETKQNTTIQQLIHQLEQQYKEQIKNNEINQELNHRLQQSLAEQRRQNRTIQQLINYSPLSSSPTNNSITTTTTTIATKYRLFTLPAQTCGCPITSTCRQACLLFGGTNGLCTGYLYLTCQCLIRGLWQSKTSQC